jgi:hypothetical protein
MSGGSLETRVEELFLRIFKWVLLGVMALSLIGALVFGAMALSSWLKSDPGSDPDPRPATGQLKLDDFLNLIEGGKPATEPGQTKEEVKSDPERQSLFEKQASAIVECSKRSLKNTEPELVEQQDWNAVLQRESKWINERADAPGWGEAWVNERRDLICAAANSAKLEELIKAGKVPALQENYLHDALGNFHSKAWGNWLEAEQKRIADERAEKEVEAIAAAARMTLQATVAASAFGLFMLIALYLIFAKIETNLRSHRHE